MDEYISYLTLGLIGRIRPYSCVLRLRPMYQNDNETNGLFAIRFIQACKNEEFREYYFHRDRVSLKFLTHLKYVIFNSNEDVLRHMKIVYPEGRLDNLQILCYCDTYDDIGYDCGQYCYEYYDSDEECTCFNSHMQVKYMMFQYRILPTNYVFHDIISDYEDNSIFEVLEKRGFKFHAERDGSIVAEMIFE